MLVSLKWLKKFTQLPDDNEELIKKIGAQVAEVESVVNLADKYEGVIVGEIVEAAEHPDADKLGVYQVNIGHETVQVVAGDKTLQPGDKAAYVAPGATVPSTWGTDDPFVIEKRPLRGQDSNGMMAAAKELGWGDDYTKVLKLDTDKPAGTTLIEAYELDDLIIEVENKTLTHRPDCFGMIGFAREVAGTNNIKFRTPEWFNNEPDSQVHEGPMTLSVEIQAEDCSRYVGVLMDNIEIKSSPILLQTYLYRVGIRPVNNVVDVTNYLMVETGQPMHAFDYDKVIALSSDEPKLFVRYPNKDEKLELLDGREIELHEKALLICTDTVGIDLAGAMGGANTEIDANTKRIILESANFDMYNVRKTSMAHGVFSEAVTRFIRGQSPEQCLAVANQGASMVAQLAGGKIAGQTVDVYSQPQQRIKLHTDANFVKSRLGADYLAEDMAETLGNVEFEVEVEDQTLKIEAPFWRRDIHIDEDIVEEVGRLKGYDQLSATLPKRDLTPAKLSPKQQLIVDARRIMVEAGNNEVLTYNFVSEKDLAKAGMDLNLAYKLRNSISPELQVLRTSLMPSLLSKVHPNIKLDYKQFGLFEINKSHRNNNVVDELPVEEHSLAYVFASDSRFMSESQNGAAYYQAQHVLNYLLDKLQVVWTELVPLDVVEDGWVEARKASYQQGRVAVLVSEKGIVGIVGEISQTVRRNYKLPDYACGFDINIDALVGLRLEKPSYTPQLKYPGTQKDVTFAVSADVKAADVIFEIAKTLQSQESMQNDVSELDAFQKDDLTKNLTYRLDLRHKEHTLTAEEANAVAAEVVQTVVSKFDAKQS